MATESIPYTIDDPALATRIYESFGARDLLPPTTTVLIDAARRSREQGDATASVYRTFNLEMGFYLGAVNYILMFGESQEGSKSVAIGITDDRLVKVQATSKFSYKEIRVAHLPKSDNGRKIGGMADLLEGIETAIKEAEYPDKLSSSVSAHKSLSEVRDIRERWTKDRNGNRIAFRGMVQRIF